MVTFGFASDNLRLSRYSKDKTSFDDCTVGANRHPGDIAHSTLFACGDFEGRVHIWDLRNVKQPATQVSPHLSAINVGFLHVPQVKCFQTGKITSVIWHESHIVASSDANRVAAIPYTYTT